MLPLPLQPVVSIFGQSVTVYDITVSRVDGREQQVQDNDRTIFAVIQPSDDKKLNIQADGELSDGALLLHTAGGVFITDLSQTGDSFVQTYVKYENEIWKANGVKTWSDKTPGINRYLLTKYVNIDDSNT